MRLCGISRPVGTEVDMRESTFEQLRAPLSTDVRVDKDTWQMC